MRSGREDWVWMVLVKVRQGLLGGVVVIEVRQEILGTDDRPAGNIGRR